MKSVVFDIECTDFDAVGAGILICAVAIPLDTLEPKIFRLDEYDKSILGWVDITNFGYLEREEKAELKALFDFMSGYDLWIGHNIERFDIPYMRTRGMRRNVPADFRPFTYDTFKAFRRCGIQTRPNGFGKPMAGLGAAADALGITEGSKTAVYSGEWWMQIWGNKEIRKTAFDAVVHHCTEDVKMNLGVYKEILPLDLKGNVKRLL